MKRYIALTLLMAVCTAAQAVTDREMEQARAIAAQQYLRYANDGSGYLDELKPKTLAELEKNLKAKERDNIKAFKAVATARDYAGWDKEALVAYWSDTFMQAPGLDPLGKRARSRIRKRIGAMTVAAPVSDTSAREAAAPQPATAKPAAPEQKPQTAAPVAETETSTGASSARADDSAALRAMEETQAEMEQAAAALDAETAVTPRRNSYTWVYITILSILVAVVVGLVVFASRVLRGQRNTGAPAEEEPAARRRNEPATLGGALAGSEASEWRDRLRASEREREELEDLCHRQKLEAERLKDEIESLREQMASMEESLRRERSHNREIPASESRNTRTEAAASERRPEPQPAAARPVQPAVIYLGRVNPKGIFVRADRNLRTNASVYRLETTDGYAGTYRVANNPEVWERALEDPEHVLSGGCAGTESATTEGKTKVVTESAGTAIFEGGCWKVIRKAKVRYQ